MSLLYLAYGSNLHPGRLGRRVLSCHAVATVVLPGHDLRFHKRGRDGSGKADLVRTGHSGDCAYGVVYRISRLAKPALDACEQGYRTVHLDLMVAEKEERVFTYLAEPAMIEVDLRPFAWYLELIAAGARHHRFPAAYLERILTFPGMEDPEPGRRRRQSALVASL